MKFRYKLKDIPKIILGGIDTKGFFRILKESFNKVMNTQEQTTAKTISRALSVFDEVNVLKMPSSRSTKKEEEDQKASALITMGASALSSIVTKIPHALNLSKVLMDLIPVLRDLAKPGQQTANMFKSIVSLFRQTEITAEAVHKKTEAVALSAGRLGSAWNSAATAMSRWKSLSGQMGDTAQMSRGIQGLSQQLRTLTNGFQSCNRSAEQTVSVVKKSWTGLPTWFRSKVAEPILRDANVMFTGICAGLQTLPGVGAITLAAPKIPQLAQGAVLPANKPFLAVVGDQKNGTNVEAPLETIKQAVSEVVGNRDVVIRFTGDLAQLARVLRPAIAKEGVRVGGGLITKEVV